MSVGLPPLTDGCGVWVDLRGLGKEDAKNM